MKNKILFIFFIIISTFFCIGFVEAKNTINRVSLTDYSAPKLAGNECTAIFGDPRDNGEDNDRNGDGSRSVANYLQEIFTFIKYLGPALAIVFSVLEFFKAAAGQDNDALSKATKKTGWRLGLAIALFFLPEIIDVTFSMIGWYGTCGIG